MKILITGANGYLGSGIVKSVLDLGHEVIATDLNTDKVDSRAKSVECNFFEIENPFDYFGKPDVMLHLAWRDGFLHYSDAHINDLPKHYDFINKMISGGLRKVSVMGSMHEIGFYEGAIKEGTPCNPTTPYGIAKNALRELTVMLSAKADINFQWLRGYYIVGNSKYGNSIFSKITSSVSEGKKEFPFTTGKNQYDFMDFKDFCDSVAKTIVQNEVNGIINICSGYPEKLSDRVERFIKENSYDIKLKYGAYPDRPYDSKAVWGDSSKLEMILKNGNS